MHRHGVPKKLASGEARKALFGTGGARQCGAFREASVNGLWAAPPHEVSGRMTHLLKRASIY